MLRLRQCGKHHYMLPNEYFEIYAPQTKILEGGTKDEIRIFD
jgi:hypothetical protein